MNCQTSGLAELARDLTEYRGCTKQYILWSIYAPLSCEHGYINRLNIINEIAGTQSIFASLLGYVVVVIDGDIKVCTNQFKYSHSKLH